MGISGKWYDPITYQLSFSCIGGKNEQKQILYLFQTLLNEIKPYIVKEIVFGNLKVEHWGSKCEQKGYYKSTKR